MAGPKVSPKQSRAGVRRISSPSELMRNPAGIQVARYSDDYGAPLLHQHAKVRAVDVVEGGEVRRVRRTVDVLAAMQRNGTITPAQAAAGRKFKVLFHTARLDPAGASRLDQVPRSRRPDGQEMMTDRILDSRKAIGEAITTAGGHGSPAGCALWFVLGAEYSIKEFAQRQRLGRGRSLNEEVARGILIGALGMLATHWGLED